MSPSMKSIGGLAVLGFGLVSTFLSKPTFAIQAADTEQQTQQARVFAARDDVQEAQGDDDDDYVCSESKECKTGCCGSV